MVALPLNALRDTAAGTWKLVSTCAGLPIRGFEFCVDYFAKPAFCPLLLAPTSIWSVALYLIVKAYPTMDAPCASRVWIGIGIAVMVIIEVAICVMVVYGGSLTDQVETNDEVPSTPASTPVPTTEEEPKYHYVEVHHVPLSQPYY
jgi:hypothetical protein